MSPEAQRIAIAEACGWKGPNSDEVKELTKNWVTRDTQDHFISPVGVSCGKAGLPDYLNDLNAMHEAESSMDMPFNSEYSHFLANVCVRCRGISEDMLEVGDGYEIALTATAAQRAEAFLKTIGKWQD